mmetsp:Transcript_6755/g.9659  ORF Transcript_6755/g.9659 Transcript_6755/m.9659 type:complete len:403 (-) Transcript_6755:78-1286(-)
MKENYLPNVVLWSIFFSAVDAYRVVVFGGSGFLGSRVCKNLVNCGCEVISVSRSGNPPHWASSEKWCSSVEWLAADATPSQGTDPILLSKALGSIDGAVSCIGSIQPRPEWVQLLGLSFDDDALRFEIGSVNENIVSICKSSGASRFVFVSVSFETAKALEGAIEGYLDGKRAGEEAVYKEFGNGALVVAPSLIYGGKRFPTIGKVWRSIVDGPGKLYVAGNDALRRIAPYPVEDWIEKMVFSPPIEVETVARVIAAGAVGAIEEKLLLPRRQEFFDKRGKPVEMANVSFIDGTSAIERLASLPSIINLDIKQNLDQKDRPKQSKEESAFQEQAKNQLQKEMKKLPTKEDAFEGALAGKLPYLYPLPVIAAFFTVFWAVANQQFVQVVSEESGNISVLSILF